MNAIVCAATPAIGVILPSSNRVVERVTRSIIENYKGIDVCFSRVPYSGHPSDGYNEQAFLDAAMMLAQARPNVIVWNATRGALLGFEPDRKLCDLIERETGIAAITTALETSKLLLSRGLTRIALLQQGTVAEGQRLVTTFAGEGISIVGRIDLGITNNFEAASVHEDDITRLVTSLACCEPHAILIWSTNIAGHSVTKPMTTALGIPVFDSASIGAFSAIKKLNLKEMILA